MSHAEPSSARVATIHHATAVDPHRPCASCPLPKTETPCPNTMGSSPTGLALKLWWVLAVEGCSDCPVILEGAGDMIVAAVMMCWTCIYASG